MASFRDAFVVATFASLLAGAAAAQAPAEERHFQIPAGPAEKTVLEFLRQSGMQGVGDYGGRRVHTQPVTGRMTPRAALARMLDGTDLEFTFKNERTVSIRRRPHADGEARSRGPRAQDDGAASGIRQPQDRLRKALHPLRLAPLQEVTIADTYIRNQELPGAHGVSLERKRLDSAGHDEVPDAMRSITSIFTGDDPTTNVARGYGIDLRGMGAPATLVLLNRRRLAPNGSEGSFVDVSTIPWDAIEEITVMPDGSSAAYGGDAVGGVVNIRLRESFEGSQMRLRIGAPTDGRREERELSYLAGTRWQDGNALLGLSYSELGALPGSDREQMSSDLRRWGGDNHDTQSGNPGTVIVGSQTWAVPHGQDGRSLAPGDLIAGTANLYNRQAGRDIYLGEERLGFLAAVRQRPSDDLSLFFDLLASSAKGSGNGPGFSLVLPVPPSNAFYVNPSPGASPVLVAYDFGADLGLTRIQADRRSVNAALGGSLELRADWQLAGHLGYSHTRDHARTDNAVDPIAVTLALADPDPVTALNLFGHGSHTHPDTLAAIRSDSRFTAESATHFGSLVTSGPLLPLPGGDAKAAVGIDHRRESFVSQLRFLTRADPDGWTRATRQDQSRDFTGFFGELVLPLAGAPNRRPGLESLQLSLSGRLESYSGHESAFVPQAGLAWSPVPQLTLRGTRSHSFRAPSPGYLDESGNRSQILRLPDPAAPTGFSTALLWVGDNSELQPETARSWTVGFDLRPVRLRAPQLAATYFDIHFRNRIQSVAASPDMLRDPQFADIVFRAPSADLRQAVCARSTFTGSATDCLQAPIDLVIKALTANTAAIRTRGVDVSTSFAHSGVWGDFDFRLDSTAILEYARSAREASPLVDVVDTEDDPPDFRLRASVGWERGLLAAFAGLNYTDDYRDTVSRPHRRVGSWTTVDARLAYSFDEPRFVTGAEVACSVQNVFDEPPPFFNNPLGLGFDPANAQLLGRFTSLQLRLHW
jgi:iron complex outermembrane recepter protein